MNEAKIRVFQSSVLVKNRTLAEKAAKDRFAITGSVQNLPETRRWRNRPQNRPSRAVFRASASKT
jgi:hypothetical protein